MSKWSIWYDNGHVVKGSTEAEWNRAPDVGVQVLVLHEPSPDGRYPFHSRRIGQMPKDRQVWTGDDTYQLNGWAPKKGSLMDWDDYIDIFDMALHARP